MDLNCKLYRLQVKEHSMAVRHVETTALALRKM